MLTFSTSRQLRPDIFCTCHIMTKNDQNTIAASLESAIFSGLFAEILILFDLKSTDNTFLIISAYARKYNNIRIVPFRWDVPQNFAKARNYLIALTWTPYAFWLDSDEILQKPYQLRAMLSRAKGQAFMMLIISPIGKGGFHNMLQPRLFPVVTGVFFECPVFERLDWSLKRAGIYMERTTADPILHPGYMDLAQLKVKNQRNMNIMVAYLRSHRIDDPQRQHIEAQYNKLRKAL